MRDPVLVQLLHVLTALPFLSVPVVIAPLGGGWRTRHVPSGFMKTRPPPPWGGVGAGDGAFPVAAAVISAVSCTIRAACATACTSCALFISDITAVVVLLMVVVAAATVSGRLLMVETPSALTDLNSRFSASSAAAFSATAS